MLSPYRDVVLREFQRHKVPLNMDVEMPTLETIRRLVQNDEGVAFLPRMCVRQDVEIGAVREVTVKELHVERKVRLLYVEVAHVEPRRQGVPRSGRRRLTRRFQAPGSSLEGFMLWTIAVIMLVLWVLGLVSSYTLGGFIHLLLVAAIVLVAVRLIQGRSVTSGP